MYKYVVIFCALLFTGCSTIMEVQQQDSFDMAVNAYEQNLLTGKYQAANGFRKTQASDRQATDFEKLKKIKVTAYELTSVNISQDRLLVNQNVEISYYNIDSMVEKTLTDHQLWKYDTDEKSWYLHSDFPDFQ